MKTIQSYCITDLTVTSTTTWLDKNGQIHHHCISLPAIVKGRPIHHEDTVEGFRIRLHGRWEAGQLILGGDITGLTSIRIIETRWQLEHPRLEAANLRCWGLRFAVWGKPGIRPLEAHSELDACWWRSAIFAEGDDSAFACNWQLPALWQGSCFRSNLGLCAQNYLDVDLDVGDDICLDDLAIDASAPLRQALVGPPSYTTSCRSADECSSHIAWNSWDYYRLSISAKAVREELVAIKNNPILAERIRYIVIDDGWQTLCGDWLPNDRFAEGMASLCDEIRAAGFVPGIWTAPFLANRHSRIGREHPEYFVQKDGAPYSPWGDKNCGPPWGDRCHLDPTHPSVQEHIASLYQKLYNWGFRYFKTDFLSNPFLSGYYNNTPDRSNVLSFHKRGQGLTRAHRRCMQQIRDSIGKDSFWLGCGSIWSTGAGLMDASRIGGDIQANWAETQKCGLSIQWASALHGKIWLNDPDFLIIRGPETSKTLFAPGDDSNTFVMASHGKSPDFTPCEAKVWATCIVMSGGHTVLSDSMCELNEAGFNILHTIIGHCGGPSAEPIDVDQDHPGILIKRNGDITTLACINWSDTPKSAVADHWYSLLPDRQWRDIWTNQTLSTDKLTSMLIAPHSCLLLIECELNEGKI